MTIRELIKNLEKFCPDSIVVLNVGRNGLANGKKVRKVEIIMTEKDVGGNVYYENDGIPIMEGQELMSVINISS